MVWVTKCCCCSLKGGVIAIGVVFLVINALGIIGSANSSKILLQSKLKAITDTTLALYVIAAICDILLLIPTCSDEANAKGKRFYLIPFLIYMILYILILIGFAIFFVAGVGFSNAAFVVSIYLVFIALGIYCEVMVYSYYQSLRDQEDRQAFQSEPEEEKKLELLSDAGDTTKVMEEI